jgi:hypothetical protein
VVQDLERQRMDLPELGDQRSRLAQPAIDPGKELLVKLDGALVPKGEDQRVFVGASRGGLGPVLFRDRPAAAAQRL